MFAAGVLLASSQTKGNSYEVERNTQNKINEQFANVIITYTIDIILYSIYGGTNYVCAHACTAVHTYTHTHTNTHTHAHACTGP